MKPDILERYVENVYAYAINHTFSREEADELAQEILFTAVRELPRLRDESRFEPWLWGVARNVTNAFRRHLGKQRAMYSYDIPEGLAYEDDYFDDSEAIYESLRTTVAMLSAVYRDIILLRYYDGLSIKTISAKLGIPEGTVRWRLSEARKKLKKECVDMKETALRPVTMKLNIYGNGNYNGTTIPFPTAFIADALSQNILYYCYEEAASVEELAKTCGVPAYYIEERIDNLLSREALVEVAKGKYRTDFIIWSDKYGIYCEEHAEKAMLPIMDDLFTALNHIASEADRIGFYKAGKSQSDLWYLYGAMAFSYASEHYCDLLYPRFRKKYDGNEWCYLGNMETGKHHRIGIGIQMSANLGSRGTFFHTCYNGIGGMAFRAMMTDTYINACEDMVYNGTSEDVEAVACAVRDGYIVKKADGRFFVTVPSFTAEQIAAFDAIADKYLAPLMPRYREIVHTFVKGYKKLFPKHLCDDAARMCRSIFMDMFTVLVAYEQRAGALPLPTENSHCDVMIRHQNT